MRVTIHEKKKKKENDNRAIFASKMIRKLIIHNVILMASEIMQMVGAFHRAIIEAVKSTMASSRSSL